MHVPKRSREAFLRVVGVASSGSLAALSLAAGVLTACGGSSGTPTLIWYINPDNGGQDAIAKNCSTDQYTISTQVLPQDATQQRVQLARRLAAHDSGIDLMSLDPPFTAEFANAGFLAPIPQDVQSQLKQQSFKGADRGRHVERPARGRSPFWSNTQVLWYRKSFADKAGIDMNKPVTWDQIITDAADNGGTVAVQANKYEGYSVWINALISGAGGQIVSTREQGGRRHDRRALDGRRRRGRGHREAGTLQAAPPDLSVSNEGTAGSTFGAPNGAFMVNWTYIYHNYDARSRTSPRTSATPATRRRSRANRPGRRTAASASGSASTPSHVDDALAAAECLVSPENQGVNAEITGNMPASPAGYQYPALQKLYPPAC